MTKLILLVLAIRADKDSYDCFPSQALIAENAECSDDTVQRALKEIKEAGMMTIEPRFNKGRGKGGTGGRTSNKYILHVKPLEAAKVVPFSRSERPSSRSERKVKPPVCGLYNDEPSSEPETERLEPQDYLGVKKEHSLQQRKITLVNALAERLGPDGHSVLSALPEPKRLALACDNHMGRLTDAQLHQVRTARDP